MKGTIVTETFDFDGGRGVTVYLPRAQPAAIVFAGDGQLITQWAADLDAAGTVATMVVGVHRAEDETARLHEYVCNPEFDSGRFEAHEKFFTEAVPRWVADRFGVSLGADRTAVCGVSASAELALAMGVRHPDRFGAVLGASPGRGYLPPGELRGPLPRFYLVAGRQEPFFGKNARLWAQALRDAGADVVMTERDGSHGGDFWRAEFPLMVGWAFPRTAERRVLEGFDPFNVEEGPRHHEKMAELRERCPVAFVESGMMILSRFDDVKAALGDPLMSNRNSARAAGIDVPAEDRMFFFEYDPPEHTAVRSAVRDLLSRRRCEERTAPLQHLIHELLQPLLERGGGEVVEEFTGPLVSRHMMRLVGFPEQDAARWRAWVKDWIRSGFSFTNSNDRGTGFAECYPDILDYLDRHIDARAASADRPDDALTCVVTAQVDGVPLTRTQQRMILASLPAAGGNTMGNFTNNTLHTLAGDPQLLERVRADRSLVPLVVEESLRRDSPSMFISRVCAAGHRVAGVYLDAGGKVLVGLASANRDEEVYPDPTDFSLGRSDQPPHVAFGWGIHTCVGAHVVRHLGATLLNTLLDQVATIGLEPGSTPVRYVSPQGNGFDELRLRFSRR